MDSDTSTPPAFPLLVLYCFQPTEGASGSPTKGLGGYRLPVVRLADLVRSPQRLQVRVMEALLLLFRVRQVKRCTGADVVDVPAVQTVVIPSHAW